MSLQYLKDVVTLDYDPEKCTGCGRCPEVCPHGVFVMDGVKAALTDRDSCMECGACSRNCAPGAITVRAGVGCAWAIVRSKLFKTEVACCE
jgi:ferredoxin